MEFKDLDFKHKLEHIWEYYKIPIFGTIFAVIVVISLFDHWVLHPDPELYCGIAVYGPHVESEKLTALDDLLTQKNVEPGVNEAVITTNFFFTPNGDDSVQDADMLDKFYTYLFTMQVNLFIANKEDLESCVKAEYVNPINKLISKEKLAEFDEKGYVLYTEATENKETLPYGIALTDSKLLKSFGILQDDTYYLAYIPSDDNIKKENTLKTAELLLE